MKGGKTLVQVALGLLLFAPMTAVVVMGTLTPDKSQTAADRPYDQMPFGNLSGAAESDHDNYMVKHDHFSLSWNQSKLTPNWVQWQMSREDLGTTDRRSNFVKDGLLPASFNQPSQVYYEHSGYDLGHLCPHADRGASHEAAYSTFVITNVVPQRPNLNRGPWEGHEESIRRALKNTGGTACVAAGPAGKAGEFHWVTIPEKCWKVVYFSGGPHKGYGWSAVIMPNTPDPGGRDDWRRYVVPKEQVEDLTGYKFEAHP